MKVLCAIGFLLVSFCLVAKPLTLVRDGKVEASVIIGSKPTKSAQLAALELQHIVQLITGAKLPIREEAASEDKVRILIGENDAVKKLGIPDKPFQREEYLIAFKDNHIILAGNDSPDYGKIDYANAKTFPEFRYTYRSSTYAVYDFLEKACGVRFYSYGDLGIVFTPRKTLEVKPLSIRRHPFMDAFRYPYIDYSLSKLPDCTPREAMLLLFRWRCNVMYGLINHSIYSIYPRYWAKATNSWSNLFIESRPSYFATRKTGRVQISSVRRAFPLDKQPPSQLCFSNQEVVEYFAEEAYQVFLGKKIEAGYANIPVVPGQPFYYPFHEDDDGAWCECEKCSQKLKKHPYSYWHFKWADEVATAAAKKDPRIGISTPAYSDSLPKPDLTLDKNVTVQLCLSIQSWYHPQVYAYQHGAYKNWVKTEAKKRPLTLWLYLLCPSHEAELIYKYHKFFPSVYPWKVGEYFKEFTSDGIRGWFGEIKPRVQLLEAYIGTKLSDDPSLDPNQMLDEFFSLYYGSSGAAMKEFYKKLEAISWDIKNYSKQVQQTVKRSSFVYGLHNEQSNWHLGSRARMDELNALVTQAKNAARTPEEKARVQRFIDHIWQQALEGRTEFENREKARAIPLPHIVAGLVGAANGDPGKVDFSHAPKTGLWRTLENQKADTELEGALANDGKYLYFKFTEKGNYAIENKKADLWTNGVEIFFSKKRDSDYLQLAVGVDGKYEVYQSSIVSGVNRFVKIPLNIEVKSTPSEGGWELTLAIPLEAIVPEGLKVGESIYVNFFRTRRADEKMESFTWSPIFSKAYADGMYRMGEMFIQGASREGEMDVNGSLQMAPGANLPKNWIENKPPTAPSCIKASEGSMTLSAKEVGKSWVQVFFQEYIPVKQGDKILIEADAKGHSAADGGVYLYMYNKNGAGLALKSLQGLDGSVKKYKIEFTIPPVGAGNRTPVWIRPFFRSNGEVTLSNIRVRIIPREKQ